MFSYIMGRVGQAVVVVWLAYTLTFFAIAMLPSDPITIHLAEISEGNSNIDPNLVNAMKEYYGYNQPLAMRYLHQLGELLHGNFGYSLSASLPVLERMRQVMRSTADLAGLAFVVAMLITGTVVSLAALLRGSAVGTLIRSVPIFFASIPTFWLGIVVLEVFSFKFRLVSIFPDGSFLGVLVPAIVLGIPLSAGLTQVLSKTVDGIYAQPFIDIARAKGARPVQIFVRHVLKNVAAPALTMMGLVIGGLVTGTVVVETVFSRPGIGRVLLQAVSTQDVALIQGFVLLAALVSVMINLLVDLTYPWLDPRVVPSVRRPDPSKALARGRAADDASQPEAILRLIGKTS